MDTALRVGALANADMLNGWNDTGKGVLKLQVKLFENNKKTKVRFL
jgi:hypothetical protein